jgi:hypothetical protein
MQNVRNFDPFVRMSNPNPDKPYIPFNAEFRDLQYSHTHSISKNQKQKKFFPLKLRWAQKKSRPDRTLPGLQTRGSNGTPAKYIFSEN